MGKALIIGGGVSGLVAAKGLRKLNKSVEIILIEPKDFCEFVWGAYRSPFDESVAKRSVFRLQPFCEAWNIVQLRSKVQSLTNGSAVLEDGTTIEFDVCCVCVGGSMKWRGLGRSAADLKLSVEDRLAELKAEGKRILGAESVLIVGGGLVGVEVAGDVVSKLPSRRVTLVHSGEQLCPEMGKSAAKAVQKQLESKGVRVLLAARANQTKNGWVLSTTGERLDADQVVMTSGLHPVHSFLPNEYLGEDGWIASDEYFRVPKSGGTLFAFGDCCSTTPNNAKDILSNISIVGRNLHVALTATESGKDPMEAKGYCRFALGPGVIIATTGPNSGVTYTSWFYATRLLHWIKNLTMFFFRFKWELGLQNESGTAM